MARLCSVVVGIALATGLIAGGADAAVTPKFSRSQARVGQLVSVFQPGGIWPGQRPMRIYLVRANIVGSVIAPYGFRSFGPPPPDRVRYVGRWSPFGRLTFRVPLIRPGRYAALAWCVCPEAVVGSSVPWSVRDDDAYARRDGSLLNVLAR